MTTVPHEQTQYDLLKDGRSVGAGQLSKESVDDEVNWASLQSVTPQALNLDLCSLQLAGAVARPCRSLRSSARSRSGGGA
jgi:hypothetical protein